MKNDIPDIDIDVANHDEAVAALPTAVTASILNNTNRTIKPHNSGVYLQNIPINPLNDLAVFDYETAENLGFFKIDLLNNGIYKDIISQEDLRRILNEPIDWSWFTHRDFVSRLFQFGNMADIVVRYAPASIPDLACMTAINRPAKKYLIGQPWEIVRENIWKIEPPGSDGIQYKFRKSHGTAYALAITVDARLKAPSFFDTVTT